MKIVYKTLPETLEELQNLDTINQENEYYRAASFISILPIAKENMEIFFEMLAFLKGESINQFDKDFIKNRMRDKEKSFTYAYFTGAHPTNGYTPQIPYEIDIIENQYSYDETGYVKLFVKTAGADSPRPIVLEKRNNVWFLKEYSSIFLGIK